jgi:hypothetical protein
MFYLTSGTTDWQEGRTVNISSTGILFRAEGKLDPDTIVDIRVHFSSKAVLSCPATVVRAEKSACAVRFRRYSILRPDNPPPMAQ